MRRECRRYLRELRCAFPVFRKSEKIFYYDFRNNIEEYQNRTPDITRIDLEEKFGLPKEVVVDYYDNMGAGTYMKLMKKTRYVKILLLAFVVFALASVLFQTYSIDQMRKEVSNTKIVSEVSEITYMK